jgi:2-phospho-L-lactate/phosphoenolpyruvate guanylyltransferase
MRTAAILPVKRFGRAKQRLGADVTAELRVALARAMVADVLDALGRTPSIEMVIVVSGEETLAQSESGRGAILIPDDLESGQSAAVTRGVHRAIVEGVERVLCVPGDCPGIDPTDLEQLLEGAPRQAREVVVIPDRHGTGTNGLLLTPPDVIEPSFGEDSCARHLALARAAGIPARIARPASLLLDIDTRADLDALRALLQGASVSGPRTREALGVRGELPATPAASRA